MLYELIVGVPAAGMSLSPFVYGTGAYAINNVLIRTTSFDQQQRPTALEFVGLLDEAASALGTPVKTKVARSSGTVWPLA
ncbi:MAG: hypothetical protein ACRELY_30100, partial [Polyangiaceae bacterium]